MSDPMIEELVDYTLRLYHSKFDLKYDEEAFKAEVRWHVQAIAEDIAKKIEAEARALWERSGSSAATQHAGLVYAAETARNAYKEGS
jgi:SMC interacting uncharacterized protein involved in chromosome segregation